MEGLSCHPTRSIIVRVDDCSPGLGSYVVLCPTCGRDNPSDAQFCNGCGATLDTAVAETPTPADESGVLTSSSFVGRQREMGELISALDDAISGHGRLVMLAGEPGIGKTRTAQELASYAETRGTQVFWGRCYEEEGAPPYWPWVQTIRSYIQQQSPEQLLAEMGPGAADIAEILHEIRHKLTDLETPAWPAGLVRRVHHQARPSGPPSPAGDPRRRLGGD